MRNFTSLHLLPLTAFAAGWAFPSPLWAISPDLVIGQVYPAGGTTGSVYNADYVEIFNRGSTPVSLSGKSVQVATATGNFFQSLALPAVVVPGGGYFLVQMSPAGAIGSALPAPDFIPGSAFGLANGSGKAGLMNTTTLLACGATATPCALPSPTIADLVAYGAANNGEGGTTVGNFVALANSEGGVRRSGGCQDTDDNNADFLVASTPLLVPRNTASVRRACSPVTISTASLPGGIIGSAYSQSLAAAGGITPYAWTATGGMPAGLTLSSAGLLSGTPTTAGSYSLGVQVTDGASQVATAGYPVTIATPLSVPNATLPNGTVDAGYNQALTALGGFPPYTWSVTGGTPPPGLVLSAQGTLYGRAATAGAYSFTAQATDSGGATASGTISVTIDAVGIQTSELSIGVVGKAYWTMIVAGYGTYSLSLVSGTLPPGLTLNQYTITGTPALAGDYPITLRVTPSPSGAPRDRAYLLRVVPPPVPTDWSPRGLFGGSISNPALSPAYAADNTLFVAGQGELFKSTNRGVSWAPVVVNAAYANDSISRVALSPSYNEAQTANDAATLFVGTSQGGIFKSTNHGAGFSAANSGLPVVNGSYSISDIALSVNFATNRTLWATESTQLQEKRVFRSTDGGASWTALTALPITTSNVSLHLLSPSPAYAVDNTLFVVNSPGSLYGQGTLYRSTDGGAGWSAVFVAPSYYNGPTDILGVAVAPDFPASRVVLLWLDNSDLYRSNDGGANFTKVTTPKPTYAPYFSQGMNLAVAPRAGATPRFYLTDEVDGHLRMSDDYGVTWLEGYSTGLSASYVRWYDLSKPKLAVAPGSPSAGGEVVLAQVTGVKISSNDGLSFTDRSKGVRALSVATLAGTGPGVIASSADYGYSTTSSYADSSEHMLFSADGGRSWRIGRAGHVAAALAYSPAYASDHLSFSGGDARPGYFVAGFRRSSDDWQTESVVGSDTLNSIAVTAAAGGGLGDIYYTANNGSVLMRSRDGGLTFAAVTLPAGACANAYAVVASPHYASDGVLYIRGATLCKSADTGATWTPLYSAGKNLSGPFAIPPEYNDAGANGRLRTVIVFAANGIDVLSPFLSTDGGATWSAVTLPSYGWNSPSAIAFSPRFSTDGTVVIGYSGTARSADGGASFTAGADGLGGRLVKSLYLLPSFDGGQTAGSAAVVGVSGAGLWRSTDGARSFLPATDYQCTGNAINALARAPGGLQGFTDAALGAGTILAATAGGGVYRSDDNGASFNPMSPGLPGSANAISIAVPPAAPTTALTGILDAGGNGQGLWKYDGTSWTQQTAAPFAANGKYGAFLDDGSSYLYIACGNGMSLRCGRDGALCSGIANAGSDVTGMDFNNQTTPTFVQPASFVKGPSFTTGNTASLWAVSAAGGPRWSGDAGSTWTATPGTNDYVLPSGQSWTVVKALGINPVTNAREVVAGSSSGLFLSRDGGVTWKSVSGAGSGLESTSKNFSATLSTATSYGTTDILVGATGSTIGGVYLSGDGGQHWTQVNQGFDPNNLSISSLVKTSCSGCPVQYYSGTYGSGVYTRTISVNPPPQFPSVNYACAGAGCSCGVGAFNGPVSGGTPVTLCGSGFQNGVAVEFDGLAASGCAQSGGTTITCTATPPHAAGYALVRVRNPDTRAGTLPGNYQYTGGTSRASALYVAKSGANGWVSWNCAGCDATNPARLYRAQNAAFSLYLEQYNGGASGTATGGCTAAAGTNSCYNQTGTVGSAQSYFWSVE